MKGDGNTLRSRNIYCTPLIWDVPKLRGGSLLGENMTIPAHRDHPHALKLWAAPLQPQLRQHIHLNKFEHEVLRLKTSQCFFCKALIHMNQCYSFRSNVKSCLHFFASNRDIIHVHGTVVTLFWAWSFCQAPVCHRFNRLIPLLNKRLEQLVPHAWWNKRNK